MWVTNVILLPCIASLISMLIIVFLLDNSHLGPFDTFATVAMLLVFVKDITFVAIALWYVAEVNGKADTLTVKLSRTEWGPSVDVTRLSVHASSVSEPISFTLLYRRVGWRDVALNTAGFGFSLLVGFVKCAVGF
jgi:hypothetical protein